MVACNLKMLYYIGWAIALVFFNSETDTECLIVKFLKDWKLVLVSYNSVTILQ